jgi:hypothetical protein
MAKAAIVILAGNESHSDDGRLANGLEAAKGFAETDGDGTLLFAGTALVVASEWVATDPVGPAVAGVLFVAGVAVFVTNMLLVVRRHSPNRLDEVVLGALSPRPKRGSTEGRIEDAH